LMTVTSFVVCVVKMEDRLPDVIAFAFSDYRVDEVKKVASTKCKTCRVKISEKVGTTFCSVSHQWRRLG